MGRPITEPTQIYFFKKIKLNFLTVIAVVLPHLLPCCAPPQPCHPTTTVTPPHSTSTLLPQKRLIFGCATRFGNDNVPWVASQGRW